jgi:hypothetical protein
LEFQIEIRDELSLAIEAHFVAREEAVPFLNGAVLVRNRGARAG